VHLCDLKFCNLYSSSSVVRVGWTKCFLNSAEIISFSRRTLLYGISLFNICLTCTPVHGVIGLIMHILVEEDMPTFLILKK
jgi:hypothetical protein